MSFGPAARTAGRRFPHPGRTTGRDPPPRPWPRAGSLHSARWICTSSGRSPHRPNAPPWTPSSGRPSRAGSAGHATRNRRARRAGGPRDRGPCSQLLPALHAVQSRIGWISTRLSTTSASDWPSPRPRPTASPRSMRFRHGSATAAGRPCLRRLACRLAGAEEICGDLTRAVGQAGEPSRDGRVTWLRSPCRDLRRAPATMFTVAGEIRDIHARPVDAAGDRAASRPTARRTTHADSRPGVVAAPPGF